jgi:hypothetical protein
MNSTDNEFAKIVADAASRFEAIDQDSIPGFKFYSIGKETLAECGNDEPFDAQENFAAFITVYYSKKDFFRDAQFYGCDIGGLEKIDPNHLTKTHSAILTAVANDWEQHDLNHFFEFLNIGGWNNDGKWNDYLSSVSVGHSSMSVGDIISVWDRNGDGKVRYYVCASCGWELLEGVNPDRVMD